MKTNINAEQPIWLSQIIEKSLQLPHQGDFNIQGLKINIHSYDPEVYNWTERYLYPLNHSTSLKTQTEYTVNVLHSDEFVLSALNSIVNSEIDSHRVSYTMGYLDRINIDENITLDCDSVYGMLWLFDRSSNVITLVLSTKLRLPLLEVSRVVRDLITMFLEDQGWILFHAGAIQTDRKNYLIIGDSGAGKTSLITALLVSGAAFISNERVFVKVEKGEALLLSFPMPIAVGLGTMVQYPELIKFVRHPELCEYPPRRMNISKIHNTPERKWPYLEDKVQFLPQEITKQFSDTEGVAGGIIHRIVVPSIQKKPPLELETLDQEHIKMIISNNCIDRSCDVVYPPWMPLSFRSPSVKDINNTISQLADLPSMKFKFFADKHSRNEISTYSKCLQEGYDKLDTEKINGL